MLREGESPLFLWNKSLPLAPLLSVQTQRGALSRKCHPMLRDSSFWPVLIDRDKAKSRRFSKSKSVCAGWSGKVPRLCAIWTPQCGGMKGKLCFIKRKSKDLVSNDRRFCEKNVSIFENEERSNKNLWTFFRNSPSILFFLPAFFRKDARSFADHDTRRFLIRTRANGHAPAHRALSEFEIFAFTLHLHPQFVDTVCFACEGNALFSPSPVKEAGVKPSPASRCFIVSYRRMVKR